ERFDAHLNEIGLSHTYERFEGGHTWEYWDEHIQDILSRLPLKK
ncbi:MAG TPA: esterase, partial [Clostridiales bacterium]|nr:esterase [Clostridiales bacterium]